MRISDWSSDVCSSDLGHVLLAKWLKDQGLLDDPVMIQLCMGIPWGAPDDMATLMAMTANLPADWVFSAFSIGRNQLPYARSEKRRVGKEFVSTCRSRWSPYH